MLTIWKFMFKTIHVWQLDQGTALFFSKIQSPSFSLILHQLTSKHVASHTVRVSKTTAKTADSVAPLSRVTNDHVKSRNTTFTRSKTRVFFAIVIKTRLQLCVRAGLINRPSYLVCTAKSWNSRNPRAGSVESGDQRFFFSSYFRLRWNSRGRWTRVDSSRSSTSPPPFTESIKWPSYSKRRSYNVTENSLARDRYRAWQRPRPSHGTTDHVTFLRAGWTLLSLSPRYTTRGLQD